MDCRSVTRARSTSSRSARWCTAWTPAIIPFRKATECQIHVSGGEFNCAANLSNCFGLKTGDRDGHGRITPSAT